MELILGGSFWESCSLARTRFSVLTELDAFSIAAVLIFLQDGLSLSLPPFNYAFRVRFVPHLTPHMVCPL